MEILFLTYEFPSLIGGAGMYTRDLALGLKKIGNNVTIITCKHGENDNEIDLEMRKKGIRIHRFKSTGKLFFIQFYIGLITKFGLNFDNKFERIILSDERAIRLSILFFSRRQLSKCVNVFHGDQVNSFLIRPNLRIKLSGIRRKFIYSLQNVHVNIAVSQSIKKTFISNIPSLNNKIKVVLHGIDDDLFNPISKQERDFIRGKYGLKKTDFIIVSHSRLIEGKGQDRLIEVFSNMINSRCFIG